MGLKKWLATLEDITIVLISHDRAFLDDTIDEVILLQVILCTMPCRRVP